MKPEAIKQAQTALGKAKMELAVLRASEIDYDELTEAWDMFLHWINRCDVKLKSGAKSGKSRPWYGRAEATRKRDPLLAYVRHARNVEHHGLDSSSRKNTMTGYGAGPGGWGIVNRVMKDDGEVVDHSVNVSKIEASYPVLVPVKDRNVLYHPPSEHLGKNIVPETIYLPEMDHLVQVIGPAQVAELALAYYEKLVGEAENFCS